MKNTKLYLIIMSVLFFFGLFVTNSYIDLRNNCVQSSLKSPCAGSEESHNRTIANMESDNVNINLERELVSVDRRLFHIKEIIHPDSTYLIVKIPINYCGDCVTEIIENLNMIKDSISCIQPIILCSGGSQREMKVRMLPFEDKFRIYNVLLSDIGLPLDWSNIPYMTLIDDGKTTKHTLIVNQGSSELLGGYIQMLSKKYCK